MYADAPDRAGRAPVSGHARIREVGPGFAFSLLLHLVFCAMFFYFVVRPLQQPQQSLVRYLPVDLVPLAERTTSPQQQLRAPAPHEALTRPARDVPASPRPPVSLSPSRKQPPPDALETRVKQLAKLRQPDSAVPHLDNGSSDETPTTNDAPAGDMAGYRVSDFLRAQVERRWSLDLKRARNTVVLIRVKVAADGTVTNVEIVDRARYANDAAWRAVALSARNAMLLSSPLNLPSNYSSGPIDVTLALNSRDVMR